MKKTVAEVFKDLNDFTQGLLSDPGLKTLMLKKLEDAEKELKETDNVDLS